MIRKLIKNTLIACVIIAGAFQAQAQKVYNESGGLVIMEMENTESPLDKWNSVSSLAGYTGSGYLQFDGNDPYNGPSTSPLEYHFKINQGGLYYLQMRCAKQMFDGRTDLANDCYVRVEGDYNAGPGPYTSHGNNASLSLLQNDLKYFGGALGSWKWENGLNNLDAGGDTNKRNALYDFKAGETYKLVVSGRARYFRIDRLMFRKATVATATAENLSNPESSLVTTDTDFVYDATTDFPNITAGEVNYYKDNTRTALAIDASVVEDRGKFARAQRTFDGTTGSYDVTITALRELDGECYYRLLVNGSVVGTAQNSTTGTDYAPQDHTFYNISIPAGATIAVESNTDSNETIDEGTGYAWARGRWTTLTIAAASGGGANVEISGELKQWHKVTLTLDGPSTSEKAATNPFSDYRMNVTFTHPASGLTYVVPGYYAADGDAADTSATSGNKWRAHLSPDHTGTWTYEISFRSGNDVAIDNNPSAGSPVAPFDGINDSFQIAATDKTGRDHRGKGRLTYVDKHHLQFAGTGEYFLKAGVDAPENLLAYDDIDDTPNDPKGSFPNGRKSWTPHAGDYDGADASAYTWQGGKGSELLGGIKYLSDKGLNVFSFLTFSMDGDDDNVFPHLLKGTVTDYENLADDVSKNSARWKAPSGGAYHDRFDVSKMAQWEKIFEYGDKKGMYLHFKTQEDENCQSMDGGALGRERKLYYRELIARFGHHLALNWNLSEETRNTDAQNKAFAQYFHDNDPYRHNVVLHTYPGKKDEIYTPMLGTNSKLTGLSLQGNQATFTDVYPDTLEWVQNSANAGKPWVVAYDEPGDAAWALRPATDPGNSWIDGRKNALWGNVMAGGAGVEFYFGYNDQLNSDVKCQDWRSRDGFWSYCRYMLEFFNNNNIPFWNMSSDASLVSNANAWCLRKPGETYVVYLKYGGTTTLNLNGVSGNFTVKWYDPRNGGGLQNGSQPTVDGGGVRSLGDAPNSTTSDWVILVRGEVTTPVVDAGADREIFLPANLLTLTGFANDDDTIVSTVWTQLSGPNTASFSGQNTTQLTASGLIQGTYVFRLTATDNDQNTGYDDLSVTVLPQGTSFASVTSFTLIDADTDLPITGYDPIADGATIYKGDIGTTAFNIRVNTSPSTDFGSVVMALSGATSTNVTESVPVWALFGDVAGDYKDGVLHDGSHTLTATPYDQDGGAGSEGTPLTINFTVSSGSSQADVVLQDWQFSDANGTQLNAAANTGTVGTSWSATGPKVHNGNLNVGDTPYYKYNLGTSDIYRTAAFTALTTGKYRFELIVSNWNLGGSDGLGAAGNGINISLGVNGSAHAQVLLKVDAGGNDIAAESQGWGGSIGGTTVVDNLGALDLTNSASVTFQIIANLDTGVWSSRVDAGSDGSFVGLTTDGTGLFVIDRMLLGLIASNGGGWEYGGENGTATEFVEIDSISLTQIVGSEPTTLLEEWMAGYPGLVVEDNYEAAAAGDQDGDGVTTEQEFYFGGNPMDASEPNPVPSLGGDDQGDPNILQYVYIRRETLDNGLTYSVQKTEILNPAAWSNITTAVTGQGPLLEDADYITVTNEIPVTAEGAFLRVIVE